MQFPRRPVYAAASSFASAKTFSPLPVSSLTTNPLCEHFRLVVEKIVHGALQARRDPAFQLDLGDLEARADWGYAPDYVDAMFRILQLPQAGDYVVASGELHSVREFVELAFDEVGLDWRDHVRTKEDLLKRNAYPLRGDASKLRDATGWSPALKFDQLVRQLVHETEEGL